jgi:uncharacterized phage-associated protein
MYTATTIANFFIEKGIRANNPVDQMKVQKLVYFAHGWHLAIAGEPLLNEVVEAWRFGPVIPSLYQALKYFGNQPITKLITLSSFDNSLQIDTPDNELSLFLNSIWNLYAPFTGIQLSNMTHEEEAPWAKLAKVFDHQIPANKEIDDRLIQEYFSDQRKKAIAP